MARWPATAVDAAEEGGGGSSKYVGWEEVYACTEKGRREIHYALKRRDGGKDLAVIASEKSLRHMTYRFLIPYTASFSKPRSKREVVDWLNSFVPDTPTPVIPQTSGGSSDGNEAAELDVEAITDAQLQKLGYYTRDFLWLGSPSICKKRRKHYQSFRRNGVKISVNEFVHVLAEEDKRLVAYLEDMYEDSKCNKMVVVRWFHKIDEVGIDLPHNYNDREIFFSLCLQDLSIECIDGLAMVLNPQHYSKFLGEAKHIQLEPYMCHRQYDNDDLQPFDITQVKGYWRQDIVRYMFSFPSSTALPKTCLPGDFRKNDVENDFSGTKPRKRLRLTRDCKVDIPCPTVREAVDIDGNHGSRQVPLVNFVRKDNLPQVTAVGSMVEVLSQDSGMRGCWFRATVIKIRKNKVKLRYFDIKDAENEANCLEEWVLASKIASNDEMGVRLSGRATIRPLLPHNAKVPWSVSVGAVVDAWQHDGWWEGIVIQEEPDGIFRVYFSGEKQEALLGRSDLRNSQEWIGNSWRRLRERPDIAASILSELVSKGTAVKSEDKNLPQTLLCNNRKPGLRTGRVDSIDLNVESAFKKEEDKAVLDLSKDDLLSQLKWKTLGKRRRSCFSVQMLQPRGSSRINSERTLTHVTNQEVLYRSPLKADKESCKTTKADRENCKYISDTLFGAPVVQAPALTSLVMSR